MQRACRPRLTRRTIIAGAGALALTTTPSVGRASPLYRQATPVSAPDAPTAIQQIVEDAMAEMDLRAVVLHVLDADDVLIDHTVGESLPGLPASTDMHFRNGAVAITYMTVTLLRLAEAGIVELDTPIAAWLPDLPDADAVTPAMLATMTAGYPDYVQNAGFSELFYADPFRSWTADELIAIGLSTPRLFAPGENWDYSHTNYVILGQVMEAAAGAPLATLLHQHILAPLGLDNTASEQSPWMPDPVLHAFSSERRAALGVSDGISFIEESTFWNPSWTLANGAVQYTTISDMARSFQAISQGELLTGESMRQLLSRSLLEFGEPLEGCPSCHTLDESYLYGLGIVQSGSWILQNPLFGGYASAVGAHPDRNITISVVTTFSEESFGTDGDYLHGRAGQIIFRRIAELLVPDDSPLIGG